MFFVKVVSRILLSVTFIYILLILGSILLLVKKKKAGTFFITASLFFLLLGSSSFLADLMLGALEKQYAVLEHVPDGIQYIAVLGGGANYTRTLPSSIALSPAARGRVLEGIRLANKVYPKNITLLFTGGSIHTAGSVAELSSDTAHLFGIKKENIMVLPNAYNTNQEAEAIATVLKGKNLVLVTDAFHMPRAIHIFKQHGLRPVPAPSSYLVTLDRETLSPLRWLPSAYALYRTELALHEYAGILWSNIAK
ncbi:MAG: hypothetical protein D3925_01930 [Candidatus Electrothrix sp. AR5]|nr:hypothetical protein [Candidatus Electrothrix sp. AR5]